MGSGPGAFDGWGLKEVGPEGVRRRGGGPKRPPFSCLQKHHQNSTRDPKLGAVRRREVRGEGWGRGSGGGRGSWGREEEGSRTPKTTQQQNFCLQGGSGGPGGGGPGRLVGAGMAQFGAQQCTSQFSHCLGQTLSGQTLSGHA